jgi:hypothetical protein
VTGGRNQSNKLNEEEVTQVGFSAKGSSGPDREGREGGKEVKLFFNPEGRVNHKRLILLLVIVGAIASLICLLFPMIRQLSN